MSRSELIYDPRNFLVSANGPGGLRQRARELAREQAAQQDLTQALGEKEAEKRRRDLQRRIAATRARQDQAAKCLSEKRAAYEKWVEEQTRPQREYEGAERSLAHVAGILTELNRELDRVGEPEEVAKLRREWTENHNLWLTAIHNLRDLPRHIRNQEHACNNPNAARGLKEQAEMEGRLLKLNETLAKALVDEPACAKREAELDRQIAAAQALAAK